MDGRRLLAFARVAVPLAVLAFLVFVHVGPVVEVAAIAAGSVWPVLVGAVDGARSVDPVAIEVATAYRVPWYHTMIAVIVPAAAPRIFVGLRVSLLVAFPLMAVGELAGGVGDRLDTAGGWAWLVLMAGLGCAAVRLLLAVERRALRWQRDDDDH